MTNRKINLFLFITILILATLACNTTLPQTQPTSTIAPTQSDEQPQIPESEARVPRVTVEDAKAAFDSGEAIIVDVRGPDAYADGHIAGAIEIPLGEIESNPSALDLDKDQWIITYCT